MVTSVRGRFDGIQLFNKIVAKQILCSNYDLRVYKVVVFYIW